jgi:hypothetical protein
MGVKYHRVSSRGEATAEAFIRDAHDFVSHDDTDMTLHGQNLYKVIIVEPEWFHMMYNLTPNEMLEFRQFAATNSVIDLLYPCSVNMN